LAIGVALRTGVSIAEAVAAAVKRTGLLSNLDDAVGDVERTLSAIAEIGVTVGADGYELEYPICGVNACGELAAGYIDLIVRKDAVISVLDFKTDEPSVGNLNPKYVEQVNGYAAVVQSCWPDVLVQRGLVFTADGAIHWL
jgi:ATP-dependent exoDNAse (exonuclease V) beta subunit